MKAEKSADKTQGYEEQWRKSGPENNQIQETVSKVIKAGRKAGGENLKRQYFIRRRVGIRNYISIRNIKPEITSKGIKFRHRIQ